MIETVKFSLSISYMHCPLDQLSLDCVFIKGKVHKNWSFFVFIWCGPTGWQQICLSGKPMGVTLLVLANAQMPLNILACLHYYTRTRDLNWKCFPRNNYRKKPINHLESIRYIDVILIGISHISSYFFNYSQ